MAADGRCKTFDARADGYVRGEGAGIVVLKPLSRALADGDPIYAVIRGSAINQDGRTNGLMAPNRLSQEAVLTDAYRRAGLSPGVVQYVEAHGTGTLLGDPIEAAALGRDSGAGPGTGQPVPGRLGQDQHRPPRGGGRRRRPDQSSAGAAPPDDPAEPELRGAQPAHPVRHACRCRSRRPSRRGRRTAAEQSPESARSASAAPMRMSSWLRLRRFGSCSRRPAQSEDRVELLPLSARSPEALAALAGRYEMALAAGAPLADLCYTAAARRGHHEHRLAVVGDSPAELAESLAAFRQGTPHPGLSTGRCRPGQRPGVVFVFSGQGSQWFGMGQRLYADEPVFQEALELCDAPCVQHLEDPCSPNF